MAWSPGIPDWTTGLTNPEWLLKKAILDVVQDTDTNATVHSVQRMLIDMQAKDLMLEKVATTQETKRIRVWAVSIASVRDVTKSIGTKGMQQSIYEILFRGYFDIKDTAQVIIGSDPVAYEPPSEILLEKLIGELKTNIAQDLTPIYTAITNNSLHIVDFPKFEMDYVKLETLGGVLVHRVRGEMSVDLWYSRST